MKKGFLFILAISILAVSLCFAGSITKGLIGKQDISWEEGSTKTFSRTASSGYSITMTKLPHLMGDYVENVKDYGATGDGTTDDTTALQAALTAAYTNKTPVFFPPGVYYTGTLTYQGQSLIGMPGSGGYENYTEFSDDSSVILGKDSEDVLYYSVDDNAGTSVFTRGSIIRDLIIVVDDTTDAAASFANRGGGGNAGIALEHLDGDVNSEYSEYNFTFARARFQNVAIIGKSFDANGKNNSIAIYQQGLIYDVTFDQLTLARCEYGFWGDYPTSNVTDLEYAPDVLRFRDCLIECENPLRIYNSFNSSINNMQVYGDALTDKGINILRVTSAVRDDTFFWNVRNLYQEIGNTSAATEIGVIEGRDHHFVGGILLNTAGNGQYYTWDADYCVVENMRINNETTKVTLIVTGGNNEFKNIVSNYNGRDWFTDSGIGNRISMNDAALSSTNKASSRAVCQNASRMTYPALAQTSHFSQSSPSTPYYGNEDMFFIPSDIFWIAPSTQPAITKSSTVGGSGEYATMISPGGQYYFEEIGRVGLDLGYQIPEGKVRIYAMVKTKTSATTQNWNIDVNEVEIDDADLIVTASWSVIHFDADLSGLTKGHKIWVRVGAPTVNQEWYLAWIAVVPYEEHSLGAHTGKSWGVYDFAVNGGATGDHVLGTLFDNTIITNAWYESITDPTSGGSATIALGVATNDANGIYTATAYDNAIWNPGWHDGTPDGTATNFTTQTTAVRDVVLTIGTAALTAGKIKVFWEYSVGE